MVQGRLLLSQAGGMLQGQPWYAAFARWVESKVDLDRRRAADDKIFSNGVASRRFSRG